MFCDTHLADVTSLILWIWCSITNKSFRIPKDNTNPLFCKFCQVVHAHFVEPTNIRAIWVACSFALSFPQIDLCQPQKNITKKGWCWHHFERLRMLKATRKDHIPNPLQRRSFQNLIVLEVVSFYKWWKIACCNNNIYILIWLSGSICSVLKGSRVQNFQDLSGCCISIGFRREKTIRCLPMLWMPFPGTATPPQRQWNLHSVDFTEGISYARRTISVFGGVKSWLPSRELT